MEAVDHTARLAVVEAQVQRLDADLREMTRALVKSNEAVVALTQQVIVLDNTMKTLLAQMKVAAPGGGGVAVGVVHTTAGGALALALYYLVQFVAQMPK